MVKTTASYFLDTTPHSQRESRPDKNELQKRLDQLIDDNVFRRKMSDKEFKNHYLHLNTIKDTTIGSEGKPFKHFNLNLAQLNKNVDKSAREMESQMLSGKDPSIVMHPQDLKRLNKSMSGT